MSPRALVSRVQPRHTLWGGGGDTGRRGGGSGGAAGATYIASPGVDYRDSLSHSRRGTDCTRSVPPSRAAQNAVVSVGQLQLLVSSYWSVSGVSRCQPVSAVCCVKSLAMSKALFVAVVLALSLSAAVFAAEIEDCGK